MSRFLVSVIVAALSLTACRWDVGERPGGCGPESGEVRVALAALPNTLDWSESSASSAENYPVLLAMNHGLTRLDEQGRVIPGLAERWEVELTGDQPPRQRYTFHLRPGLVWSDGTTPITARDFVFGWRRALLGKEAAEFTDIVGAEEVLAARASDDPFALDRALPSFLVEAVDDQTLRVTLRSPRSYFLSRVANVYTFFPQSALDLEHTSADVRRRYFRTPDSHGRPLVSGAYRLVSWDRLGRTIRLERNPHDPFAPKERVVPKLLLVEAPLSTILYERCQVDFLLLDDPSTLANLPVDASRTPLLSVYWLGINAGKVPLPLRKAIGLAIDRSRLVEGVFPHVRVAKGYLPPEMPGAPDPADPLLAEAPHFDPAKARELLGSAYDGSELTLLVRATRTFLPEKVIADAVRRQLEEVGVRVRVVETANFANEIQSSDGQVRHHLFLKRVGADYAHPQTLLTPFQKDGINYTGFASIDGGREVAAFQSLLDEGAAFDDPMDARNVWARAESLLVAKNAVVVPLFYPERYYRRRPWLDGLTVDPFNFLTLGGLRFAAAEAR